MAETKIPRSVGTHSGVFHADEVTACALLFVYDLIDTDKIIRTRDLKELDCCEYVCDVGGEYDGDRKRFDHHQVEYQGEKSSAGMVLEYLLNQGLMSQKEYEYIHFPLIQGVDAVDNGRAPSDLPYTTFSQVIWNFTPIQYDVSEEERTKAFMEAFEFIYAYLQRLRQRFFFIQENQQIVAECMAQDSACLIFEKNIPWMENFFELGGETHPANFVIMPSGAHWKLRGIPPSNAERMSVRVPLPEEWAGLLDEDLKQVSGIEGAIFCHKGRFISVWETKADALKAFEYIKGKL